MKPRKRFVDRAASTDHDRAPRGKPTCPAIAPACRAAMPTAAADPHPS